MVPRTHMLLAATAMAMVIAGCGGTQQDASGSRDGSTQQPSAGANTTSAGVCADSRGTDSTRVDSGETSNGKIVFVRRIGSGSDIYVINEDGTHETRLTRTVPAEVYPGWSPDGEKIAFVRNSTELCVMNADGSGLRRLANAAGSDSAPTWAPDGERIAFFCPPGPGASTTDRAWYTDLCAINADGTEWTRLVLKVDAAVNYSSALWSSG